MGCCSTENFQFSRWWAVTQYSYWYISVHYPFILCAGKSSLTFLPPELTKDHPVSAGLICLTMSCPVHLRPDQVKDLLVQYFSFSLFQLIPKCGYSSENMQVIILNFPGWTIHLFIVQGNLNGEHRDLSLCVKVVCRNYLWEKYGLFSLRAKSILRVSEVTKQILIRL